MKEIEVLFVEVLKIAGEMGLRKMGTVGWTAPRSMPMGAAQRAVMSIPGRSKSS